VTTKKKVTTSAAKAAARSKAPAPSKTGTSGTRASAKAAKATKVTKAAKVTKATTVTKAATASQKATRKVAAKKTAVTTARASSKAAAAAKTSGTRASAAKPSGVKETSTKATSPAKPVARPAASAARPVKTTKAASDAAVKAIPSVTAKKNAEASSKPADPATEKAVDNKTAPAAKTRPPRTTLDDLALDVEEKDQLLEEEKRDLAKALREDDDEPLETAFVPTDTSERIILVVDEDGQRRNETISIVQQILPNAVIELADDPEEALEVMEEAEFDTYVVNFLMPGFSASPFVKAVTNHPDRPLLIGFAADKISDALDQRKGLKIIPLKRLFDLDPQPDSAKEKAEDQG